MQAIWPSFHFSGCRNRHAWLYIIRYRHKPYICKRGVFRHREGMGDTTIILLEVSHIKQRYTTFVQLSPNQKSASPIKQSKNLRLYHTYLPNTSSPLSRYLYYILQFSLSVDPPQYTLSHKISHQRSSDFFVQDQLFLRSVLHGLLHGLNAGLEAYAQRCGP
jgi:hypothetical protein